MLVNAADMGETLLCSVEETVMDRDELRDFARCLAQVAAMDADLADQLDDAVSILKGALVRRAFLLGVRVGLRPQDVLANALDAAGGARSMP